MLIHRCWVKNKRRFGGDMDSSSTKEGWFLFGFIPIYIKTIKFIEYN